MTVTPTVDTQIAFEKLYDKNQTMTRLRREYDIPDVRQHLMKNGIPLKFGIALMSQMVLHKRTTINVLVGILYHHFKDEENPFQACADMILKSIHANLLDYNSMGNQCIVRINVSQDVWDDLERYQYPLPMLIEPMPITDNTQTGYVTQKGSVILRNNATDDDVCLDTLNSANKVALTINQNTARMVQNSWADLDKQKSDETWDEYQQRVRAFEKYDRSSRDIMEHLAIHGNCFYLTHSYDKRGRRYCNGYHVSYQGNEWNKAVIEFANEEVIDVD
jgi:hypothetical protein